VPAYLLERIFAGIAARTVTEDGVTKRPSAKGGAEMTGMVGRMAGWILDWTAGFTSSPAAAAVLGSLRRGLSLITPIRLPRAD
jgi:hypothetical protein